MITLPLVFEELTPDQQKIVLMNRKPKEKRDKIEEFKVRFDHKKYLKLVPDKKKER